MKSSDKKVLKKMSLETESSKHNPDKISFLNFWLNIEENLNNHYYKFISKEMLKFMSAFQGKKIRNKDGI